MMRFKAFIFFFYCFVFYVHGSIAQTPFAQYALQKITQDDGLSQGSNYYRYEDSKGFMWITGNDAVNRYDGAMVKVYNLKRFFKDCPTLQQGYGFAEDEQSNMYIGSVNGLYIYHRQKDQFSLLRMSNTAHLEAMPIGFYQGKIWFFNKAFELFTYDPKLLQTIRVGQLSLPRLSSIHVYDLIANFNLFSRMPFFDANGNIWLVTKNELLKFDCKHNSEIKIQLKNKRNNYISCFYDKASKEIFIGTENGFIQYNTLNGNEESFDEVNGVKLTGIEAFAASSSLIALKCDKGLLFIDKQFARYKWIENTVKKFNRLYTFSFDKSGRLWMCDDGVGQLIYNFNRPTMNSLPGDNPQFKRLKETGVGNFDAFANGDVMVQNFTLFTPSSGQLASLKFDNLIQWWSATDTFRKGFWLIDRLSYNGKSNLYFVKDKNTIDLKFSFLIKDSLGICQSMTVLDDGTLFCAFQNDLCLFYPDKKLYIKLKQPQKGDFYINALSNNYFAISYLQKDMWLCHFDANKQLQFEKKILPGVQTFYVKEDLQRHQYWVGTNNGVYLLDKNWKTVKIFDANNGLAGTYIYGLLLDKDGNAWCSHQRGISSINVQTFRIVNFDKNDGIQNWDFNNRAFYKAPDGTMYFGGVSGFNYFKPPLIPFSFYKPEVYVDEILVNNKPYLADTNADLIDKLQLSFDRNNLRLKVVVKDLDGIHKIAFRLSAKDAKWQYLPNNSTISFNNLAPGKYTLQLGVYDKYSGKTQPQKSILITIGLPFYFEAWFWAIFIVAAAAFVFWQLNRRKLRKQKLFFEQQLALEQQRNKITADLHDDIGASLSSLQVNSAVAHQLLNHNHPERAQKVLEKIANQSKNLSERIGDMIWSMKPGKDEFMTMSSRIKNFAAEILGDTDINFSIKIDKAADTDIVDITIRKNIVFIAKEAINNVAKYSKATELILSINIVNSIATLTVSDNGIGFDTSSFKGNGIGNMRKRAQEINASFELHSAANQGVKITIRIPV